MKIEISCNEILDIVASHYRDLGHKVSKTAMTMESTGRVRNVKIEMEIKVKK